MDHKQNLKRTSTEFVRVFRFDPVNDVNQIRVSATDVAQVTEEWDDIFEKVEKYEITQTAVGTFFKEFMRQSSETTFSEKVNGTIAKRSGRTFEEVRQVGAENVTLNVNGKTHSTTLVAGVALIPRIILDKKRDPKVTLDFDGKSYDVSNEANKFLEAQEAEKEVQRLKSVAEADRKACEGGNRASCDRLDLPAEQVDLAAFLDYPGGQLMRLEKFKLYTGQSFEVVQKVPGGYFFTPNKAYFRHGTFRPAFLRTTASLKPGISFCAWFYYVGPLAYVGTDGFDKETPEFHVFNGTPPRGNDYCESTSRNRVNFGGRLRDR